MKSQLYAMTGEILVNYILPAASSQPVSIGSNPAPNSTAKPASSAQTKSPNVVWHVGDVTREMREGILGQKGYITNLTVYLV
jgi:hypothetical protein